MNLSDICRCCHTPGQHKSLEMQYSVDDAEEAYSLILQDVLNIEIHRKLDVSSGICEVCICRLKQAMTFKNQVLMCEEKLLRYLISLDEPDIKEEVYDPLDEPDVKEEVCDDKDEVFIETDNTCNENIENSDFKEENLDSRTSDQEIFNGEVENKPKNSAKKRRKLTQQGWDASDAVLDLRCHICMEQQPSLTILRIHVDKHNTYTCAYCHSTYSNRKTIIRHIQQHLGLREFRCKICSKLYQHQSALREHLLRHNGTYLKIVCDYCGKKFGNKHELQRHTDSIHLKLKNISCTICDAKFSIIKGLKSHMKKKHSSLIKNENIEQRKAKFVESCDLCSKSFSSASSLVDHMLLFHKNDKSESELLTLYPGVGKIHNCRFCDAKYYNSLNLNRHMFRHKDMKLKLYCCEFCSERFSTKYVLERHKLKHTGVKTVKCPMCYKSYYRKESLKKHVMSFHVIETVVKEKVKCSECARSVYNLEEHMKCHRRKPFECVICQRRYPKINSLNRHMEMHRGVRYECDICSRSYVMKSKMLLHKKKVHLSIGGASEKK